MSGKLSKNSRLAWAFFKNNLKDSMEFKLDFILFFVGEIVFIIVAYFISLFIVKTVPKFGISYLELFLYSQTIDVVFAFALASKAQMVRLIKSGNLNNYLIRPINTIYYLYLSRFSSQQFLLYGFKFILLILFVGYFTNINILLFFLVVFFAIIATTIFIQGFVYLILSLDLVKIEAGSLIYMVLGEQRFRNMLTVYPVYIFPRVILMYVAFFPIYYVASLVLGLVFGTGILNLLLFLGACFLIGFIFIYFAHLAFKRLLKYYEGFGG